MQFQCGYAYHRYMNNLVAYTKKLHNEGYTNKQIHYITKISQVGVSRIIKGTTHKDISASDFWRVNVFEDRIQVLNTLLECHEIAGGTGLDQNNKLYIKVLKKAGVNFDKVKNLYYDISKKALRNAWMYPDGKIEDFDGSSINISTAELLDLFKEKED
jgi:hypothetical protein